jgi:hypothetical protein
VPEPKWLALWSVLEVSDAVIIRYCPAFAALIHSRRNPKCESLQGYVRQSGGPSDAKGNVGIKLETLIISRSRGTESDTLYGRIYNS